MAKIDYWDLKGRPHTKLKLEIYRKYLNSWCTIFSAQKYYEEIYIVDCFAGRGWYDDYEDKKSDGSPLIAVKAAKEFQERFQRMPVKNKKDFKIKCIFIENNEEFCNSLEQILSEYRPYVDIKIIHDDFNKYIPGLIKEIGYKPALFFIDPYGIKALKRESVLKIVQKPGARDILLNYINEGVVRIKGLAQKHCKKDCAEIKIKELKTVKNLYDFLGPEVKNFIDKSSLELLKYYVDNILMTNEGVDPKNKLEVIAFDMPYPHKCDTIYYLIFASRNKNAIKVVRQVYAKSKSEGFSQQSLFGPKEQSKLNKDFKV